MDDSLLDAARTSLGVDYLFPYQRLVVQTTLEAYAGTTGEEATRQIVLLPTGAGKSLCFFLPAALLPGLTVVVYPLKALIRDQQRRLTSTGIRAEALSGDLPREARIRVLKELAEGAVDMLLTNPEILCQPRVREAIGKQPLAHFVVDEAHCLVDWGQSFRPAYLTLGETIHRLGPRVVSAYTATASPGILDGIRTNLFGDEETHLVRGNPDRPNIHYSVLPVLSKARALAELLAPAIGGAAVGACANLGVGTGVGHPGATSLRPSVVFAATRLETELTCRALRWSFGDDSVRFYHAGLSASERLKTESWFNDTPEGILVATCAYGMGVDRKGIRSVIHRDLPQSVERYLQEAGRAGRDGAPASAILLSSPEDRVSGVAWQGIAAYPETDRCRRAYLLALLGSDLEACSGCDTCDRSARRRSPLEGALVRGIAENRRRFTPELFEEILAGRYRRHTELYGLMARWQPEEREEALENLFRSGSVRIIERGVWKGRLTVVDRPREL